MPLYACRCMQHCLVILVYKKHVHRQHGHLLKVLHS